MKIGYNPPSMEAYNAMLKTGRGMMVSSARLSTGVKINKASQNAAGLAISNTLRTQAEGLDKAGQNTANAITLLQTVDGALSEMHAILQRMRELTVQANNDTNNYDDREKLQKEIEQLKDELDSMSDRCEYNQMKLLRGDGQGGSTFLTFHTGANKGYNMEVEIPLVDSFTLGGMIDDDPNPPFFMSVRGIYVDGEERFGESLEDARIRRNQSLEAADASIDQLSRIRATIGAYINRLEHTATYVSAANIAAQTSLSRIFDTDMAAEMSNYSRLQVLTQTATSIMAQANQTPQNVLQLLN